MLTPIVEGWPKSPNEPQARAVESPRQITNTPAIPPYLTHNTVTQLAGRQWNIPASSHCAGMLRSPRDSDSHAPGISLSDNFATGPLFGKNRDALGTLFDGSLNHCTGKGSLIFPGNVRSHDQFALSSGAMTLAALPTQNDWHWSWAVTSGTSNMFLTPDWSYSTSSVEPRDLCSTRMR